MNTIQPMQEINMAELYKRVIEKLLVKSGFTEQQKRRNYINYHIIVEIIKWIKEERNIQIKEQKLNQLFNEWKTKLTTEDKQFIKTFINKRIRNVIPEFGLIDLFNLKYFKRKIENNFNK